MPVGLFGKYPAKRDYVSVNMPRTVLQPLEMWLASSLATSRDRLGRRWQEFYMVQPIWNFRLGAAVVGVECLGVLAPSVDAVGRAFPLVILGYCNAADRRLAKEDAVVDSWLAQATSRLFNALSDTPPGEATGLVADLPEPPSLAFELPGGTVGDRKECVSLWDDGGSVQSTKRIEAVHQVFAADHRTVWWSGGSNLVAAKTVSFDGFPDAEFGVKMMASATGQIDVSESREGSDDDK